MVAVLAIALTGAPVEAQTIFQTLTNLRATVQQLSGHPANPQGPSPTPRSAAVTAPAVHQPPPAVIPAVALSEDPSDSRLEGTPLIASKVETFDVLGFKLGMSPREVARIAARNEIYSGPGGAQLTGSFDMEAAEIANRELVRPTETRSKTYVATAFGESRRGESFIFHFTLESTGPKLSRLNMEAKLNGQTAEQIRAAFISKYGPITPTNNPYRFLIWGDSCMAPNCKAVLEASVFGSKISIKLDRGTAYENQMRAALEARSKEVAAKHGTGVRF